MDQSTISAIVILITPVIMYFGPSIVAHARQQPDLVTIFALNLLLGWTVIGWIVALVWALKVPR